VADYKLSRNAGLKLRDIFEYTDETFRRYQPDNYHAGLEKTFGLIAEFPRIGRAVDELFPGLRIFRFQSHHISYALEDDHVLIMQIFHVSQDIRPELFG
jgi:toxin ParE1/3/4